MLSISVRSDIEQALAKVRTITERQSIERSVRRALNWTAEEVRDEVRKNLPQRFTLRRESFIKQGIRVKYASNANLTAAIYSRDDFMGLQEYGGTKSPLGRFVAVPTRLVRRTPKGLIAKRDRPKNLGDKAEIVEYKGRQWLALKKPRAGKGGNDLRLLYLLIPRANIQERLGLRKDAERVARERFAPNLQRAVAYYLARSAGQAS